MKSKSLLLLLSVCVLSLFSLSGFAADPVSAVTAVSLHDLLSAGAFDPASLAVFGGLTVQAMREKRTALVTEARNLHDKMPAKPSEAEVKAYDDKLDEIGVLDAQIGREQKLLDLSAENAFKAAGGREIDPLDPKSVKALHAKWLRGGDKAISGEEWAAIRNTMSTTTPSEGGYAVQSDVAKELVDSLKAFGGMRSVSTIIQTAQGNPLSYPTSDGTSETGEWIAENVTATAADPTFGTKALTAYKASSKIVAVPFELLQDSSIDIEAFVNGRLATRLGRITNTGYTVGSGSAQPQGVSGVAASGKVGTTGQTTTVIFDDLVDLIHSVDPAYRAGGKCVFMMNDSSFKVIRKLKDSQNRPVFIPGWDGLGKPMPDTLLGYPVVTNQDVAVMAANAKSILFGDFSKYIIRDVMQVTLFRFTDSAYAKLGQVGFLAWMRTGGNLVDTAAVKYYQNSAT